MAHRDFSGIVYLNDDYQGGEFYFTALNTVIKPKKGMLVAITAGFIMSMRCCGWRELND